MFATKKGALQQYTVQYNIAGALDRNTPAPAVTGSPDEEGVYQVPVVGDLGIIDPDFMGGVAARGDRFMVLLRLETAVPLGAGFFISTVDATGSVPSLGNIVELRRLTPLLTGLSSFILTDCVTIPQGQALTIGPLAAPPPGTFHRLTVEVRAAVSADDEARLAKACCCAGGDDGGDGGGGGDDDADIALQYYGFSSLALPMVDTDFGNYFTWSGSFDEGGPTDSALAIVAITAEEDLAGFPGVNKLTLRPGSITAIVMHTTTPLTVSAFVEISVGAGAFVRTVISPAFAVPANTNTPLPIAETPFVANSRLRVGYTIVGNAIATVIAELEIATPLP